jgi:hypothetical protein
MALIMSMPERVVRHYAPDVAQRFGLEAAKISALEAGEQEFLQAEG